MICLYGVMIYLYVDMICLCGVMMYFVLQKDSSL